MTRAQDAIPVWITLTGYAGRRMTVRVSSIERIVDNPDGGSFLLVGGDSAFDVSESREDVCEAIGAPYDE